MTTDHTTSPSPPPGARPIDRNHGRAIFRRYIHDRFNAAPRHFGSIAEARAATV
jgi:hypothetical protein